MLKDSLPQFVREMEDMALLLSVAQDEMDRMGTYISGMERQFWITTATYSIDDWERELGIGKNSTLTSGQRRAQVLAKLNTRAPSTVKMIQDLVARVLGEPRVEVVEDYEDRSFTITVISDHVPENMEVADEAVRRARPAHLGYGFIDKIARDSIQHLYMATAERKMRADEADVDTRRRGQTICVGCQARMVRIMEGDVGQDEISAD